MDKDTKAFLRRFFVRHAKLLYKHELIDKAEYNACLNAALEWEFDDAATEHIERLNRMFDTHMLFKLDAEWKRE